MSSSQQKTIINAMAVNEDGVLATGGMYFLHFGYASMVVPDIMARGYSFSVMNLADSLGTEYISDYFALV